LKGAEIRPLRGRSKQPGEVKVTILNIIKSFRIKRVAITIIAGLMLASQANAAVLVYEFSSNAVGNGNSGSQDPYLTLTLDDSGVTGSVQITIDLAADIGNAQLSELYLNLDFDLIASNLGFMYLDGAGPGPTADQIRFDAANDQYKAAGSGAYDIRLGFETNAFQAGESASMVLTLDGLTVESFDFFSANERGNGNANGRGNGNAFGLASNQAMAKLMSGGMWSRGAWVEGQVAPVPVPASVWMLGSALGFLGWKGRQSYIEKQAS
jgi:hypothetical protein